MIAHIRLSDHAEQNVKTHVHSVAKLCMQFAKPDGLSNLAYLAGIMHDLGKCTKKFETYLRHQANHPQEQLPRNTAVHSPAGAIFAFERWHHGGGINLLTSELLSVVIRSHHGGLIDILDLNGESHLMTCLQNDKKDICYEEAVCNFLQDCISETELDSLFMQSCTEVMAFIDKVSPRTSQNIAFQIQFLCRLMLSYLVDADRLDSACFEKGVKPEPFHPINSIWADCSDAIEAKLSSMQTNQSIDYIRQAVSIECYKAGMGPQGLYSLTVPTGGGKTLSSLRFALSHAKEHALEHIIYVVPYNTILEQNAQVIRDIIKEDYVLEHHCNVVIEDEAEEVYHHRLTERWDVPVILTSMVQFLNTLFHHGNTDTRRMHQLCRSVIIFDEVQALPAKCHHLFQLALCFLTRQGKSTVLLCTATQPLLCEGKYASNLNCHELISDVSSLFRELKRTVIHDETNKVKSIDEAASALLDLQQKHKSVLLIANTKKAAADIYNSVKEKLSPKGVICIYLSTSLCPAHRMDKLNEMLLYLDKQKKGSDVSVVCISTALIEAGVDISFPCVVRSYAGLPNMIQAAGRCNRNKENVVGHVYLWSIRENLTHLKEIEEGQKFTRKVQDQIRLGWSELEGDLASPQAIQWYYKVENQYPYRYDYPFSTTNLVDLLSTNTAGREMWRSKEPYPFKLTQAFQTAEKAFTVIDQDTQTILVPYRSGGHVIERLSRDEITRDIIRKAQQYTVQVFSYVYERLKDSNAVFPLGKSGVYALEPQYYSDDVGLLLPQDD